jgi:hypothetical protein
MPKFMGPHELVVELVSRQNERDPEGMEELFHEDYRAFVFMRQPDGSPKQVAVGKGNLQVREHWRGVFERHPGFAVKIRFIEPAGPMLVCTIHSWDYGDGRQTLVHFLVECSEDKKGRLRIASATITLLDPLPGLFGKE